MSKSPSFEELLDLRYGNRGSVKREAFEEQAHRFGLSDMLRLARKDAGLTQAQLAEKLGTRKSFISRIENGKADIRLSTLFRLIEVGLGKRMSIQID